MTGVKVYVTEIMEHHESSVGEVYSSIEAVQKDLIRYADENGLSLERVDDKISGIPRFFMKGEYNNIQVHLHDRTIDFGMDIFE